ncbi:hypothetical protein TKK_0017673 [Trichogramma kaykai]
MLALVFWTTTKEISIVKAVDLNPDAAEGEETMVNYKNGRSYKVKILKKSYDMKYLEKILVDKDGELLPPKPKTCKNSDLSKKLELGLKNKNLNEKKTKFLKDQTFS